MAASLANLAVAAGVLLLAAGIGNVILNIIGLRKLEGRKRPAFALALGLMAIALGTLALGHAGLLYPRLFRAIALTGGVLLLPSIFAMRSHVAGQRLVRKFLHCSMLEKILIILVAAQACAILLVSLAPPVAADALAYHLAVPKIYISHHAIIDLPNHKHAAQPFLMEMIFLFGMLLRSDIVAQLLNFALTCAAGGSVYLVARRFFSRRVGIIATAAFMLTPQLIGAAELLGPESGMAFYVMLTFLGLAHWAAMPKGASQRGRMPWLVVVSLLSAGVAGMKQSGVGHVALIAPAALLIPLVVFRERTLAAARSVAVYAAITGVLGGGWYLRCYAMTGNPIHPFRSARPFAGKAEGRTGLGKTFGSLVAYPWNITMHGRSFGMLVTDNPGPLPLAFIPLLLLVFRPVPRVVKLMLLYTAAFAAAIFFTSQVTRYLVPVLGFTSIAAAVAIERMEKLGKIPALAAAVAVMVACAAQVALSARTAAGDNMDRLKVAVGEESRPQFLSKASYSYDAFQFLNRSAPPGSRVMLLYGHAAYYLDLPYVIAGFTMVGSPLCRADYQSHTAFLSAVRGLDVSFVYVDEFVRDLFYKHRTKEYPHVVPTQEWFLRSTCRLVFKKELSCGGRIRIYELIDGSQSTIDVQTERI